MRFSLVPFLLLVIPLAEVTMFILVGSQIGVLPTLGLIVLTAIAGSILLRVQGFGLLQRISAETKAGRVPGRELIHSVMILVAGVLLLTPGFISDTLGLLLFIPAVRDVGWRLVKNRISVVAAGMPGAAGRRRGPETGYSRHAPQREPVIDLDEEDFEREPAPDSPWHNENGGDGGPSRP